MEWWFRGTVVEPRTVGLGCLAAALAIALISAAPRTDERRLAAEVQCTKQCPVGTRVATFAVEAEGYVESTVRGGGFFYTKSGCEAYCEPIQACPPPHTPVITHDEFRCQLVPGYEKLPPAAEVDTSWGVVWDEAAVAP